MADNEKKYNYMFKLLLIGDGGVGKSSLLNRFTRDTFSDAVPPTVKSDARKHVMELDGNLIKLNVWDTPAEGYFGKAGDDFYKSKYKHCEGVCVVYDLTDGVSFDNCEAMMEQVSRHGHATVKKILVGNAVDRKAEREVDAATARACARDAGAKFMETSAKTGHNVESMFFTLVRDMISERLSVYSKVK